MSKIPGAGFGGNVPVPVHPQGPPLVRALTPLTLTLFIIGDIVGGGIYALVGEVAGVSGGALWAPFLLAFLLAMLTAGSYAELVTKYPLAGGAAVYVARAYKLPALAFVTGIAVLASGMTSAASLATAFGGDYFQSLISAPQVLISLLFLTAVSLVNLRGISESVKLNVVLTIIEVAGLLAIVIVAAKVVLTGDGDPGRALEFANEDSVFLVVLSGAALAFYSFVGFEDTANLAEETQAPSRTFPRALVIGMLAAGALYLAVTTMASMAVPTEQLVGSDGPLLEVIHAGGIIPLKLFAIIGLFAVANGALINLVMASRLLYGMSRENLVPQLFGRVLAKRRTPVAAIIFTSLLTMALVATGDIGTLASTTSLLLICVFTLVNGAVLVLRRERVEHDHFTIPTVVPVLGIGACVALMTQQPGAVWGRAGLLVGVGIGLWIVRAAHERMRRGDA